jgi:hypothetical protein
MPPTQPSATLIPRQHPSGRVWWRFCLLFPFLLLVLLRPKTELHPCLQTMLENPGMNDRSHWRNARGAELPHPYMKPLADAMTSIGIDDRWLYIREPDCPFYPALRELTEEYKGQVGYPLPQSRRLIFHYFPVGWDNREELIIGRMHNYGRAVRATDGRNRYVVVMVWQEAELSREIYIHTLLLYDCHGRCLDGMVLYAGNGWSGQFLSQEVKVFHSIAQSTTLTIMKVREPSFFGIRSNGSNPEDATEHNPKEWHKIVIRQSRFVDLLNHSK